MRLKTGKPNGERDAKISEARAAAGNRTKLLVLLHASSLGAAPIPPPR